MKQLAHAYRIGALSALLQPVICAALLPRAQNASSCPGYSVSNVQTNGNSLSADLYLSHKIACNLYGQDIRDLKLQVEYQTDKRLHVMISDSQNQVYQIPEEWLPRPANNDIAPDSSELQFSMIQDPFSFAVSRRGTNETLFNTSGHPLIFESQYIGLRTQLPDNPNIYGLGETTDDMRLPTSDYVRTLWSRESPGTPQRSNLYGNHPVYFDHRDNGTHGVFLANSDGMDVKINKDGDGQYLEYNVIGGIVDLYFLSGPEPKDVAAQYSEVVGKPAMMSYWHFGFHNCKYGYQDVWELAEVIANYSNANIPLETQWSDIDYMDRRRDFSLDPYRYNISLVRQIVDHLHSRDQHYIMMTDPAIPYQDYPPFNDGVSKDIFLKRSNGSIFQGVVWPGVTAFPDWTHPSVEEYWSDQIEQFFSPSTGVDIDAIWIDMNEASVFLDYPNEPAEAYAATSGNPPRRPPVREGSPRQIAGFGPDFQPRCHASVSFSVTAQTVDKESILILGNSVSLGDSKIAYAPAMNNVGNNVWNIVADMPANGNFTYQFVRAENGYSNFIYENSTRQVSTGDCGSATQNVQDTIKTSSPSANNTKRSSLAVFRPIQSFESQIVKRQGGQMTGLDGRDLMTPKYSIGNYYSSLSTKTINTDLIQANGIALYDMHNMWGRMMSRVTRKAMLNRRPSVRPLVISRSNFAGTGSDVGHWTGDNVATWDQLRFAIAEIQEFAAFFQVPMIGADICGFNGDTTPNLCSRWVFLGAFQPFFRDHSEYSALRHELYYDDQVASAARVAIDARYRLLDYLYTAFWRQSETGAPCINPMFFIYPNDRNTAALQWQYFFGDSLLIAPVTQQDATEVEFYMPNDQFYDFWTYSPVKGTGSMITVTGIGYDTMPVYYKGGSIVPLRVESANTTKAVRTKNFNVIIAPDASGKSASGQLYLDDGDSLKQAATSVIDFAFSDGTFNMSGKFDYDPGNVVLANIILLGQDGAGQDGEYNSTSKAVTYNVNASLKQSFTKQLH